MNVALPVFLPSDIKNLQSHMSTKSVATRAPSQNPVNVLFVESNVDGTIGGSYLSLFFLASGLDRSQYNPIVLFASRNELIKRYQDAGIDTRVQKPRVPFATNRRLLRPFARAMNLLAARIQSLRAVFLHMRMLRLEKISLLHLNNSIEASHEWSMAALLVGIPRVVHERGILERYSLTTRLLARPLSAVICVSDAVRDNLSDHGFGHLPMTTIHNGLDASDFCVTRCTRAIHAELGLRESVRLLGIVGNMQRWKGQDVVVRAIATLRREFPDLRCLLIGDVSRRDPDDLAYYGELQRLIAEHSLQDCIVLTGYKPDVANYVNALEVLIHASIKPEPFGRVLLEGMALRKPIVASKAGGVGEIVVDGETGLLYRPGDGDELADALRRFLRDQSLRDSMGQAGYRRLLDSFGVAKNVSATERIYRSVLNGTP
jgi:glycosyltransferase involved in cell wall biosynthesis